MYQHLFFFFFSSRRRHTRFSRDWSSDVCSSDLGILVLGVLWWSWVGYSWLTSVVDPEEGAVRLTIFAAMAALLVAALCVPTVFDDTALLFAATYAVVRGAQIVLFVLASRDDPGLRHSVLGLAVSTAIGTGLLIVASFTDGALQG